MRRLSSIPVFFNRETKTQALSGVERMADNVRRYNVVAAGRAYTDVIARVSAEFLQTHQIPVDGQRACSVTELKRIQETLPQTQIVAGGSGANSVAIISALGGKAGFFGKIYGDEAGKIFLNDLMKRNVDLTCQPYAQAPELSATCLILLSDDKRSFAFNPGCGDSFSSTDFDKFDFSTTDYFLIEAHLLTSSVAKNAIMAAMEHAKNKTDIVINLQGITQWGDFAEAVNTIAAEASIVIGNQEEQESFAQALTSLQQTPRVSQLVVTTKGADGAEISQSGQLLCRVPAEAPKEFVSSIGAGDAFIAGFLLGQSNGMGIEESMRHAVQVASAILEETGARPTGSLAHLFQLQGQVSPSPSIK